MIGIELLDGFLNELPMTLKYLHDIEVKDPITGVYSCGVSQASLIATFGYGKTKSQLILSKLKSTGYIIYLDRGRYQITEKGRLAYKTLFEHKY